MFSLLFELIGALIFCSTSEAFMLISAIRSETCKICFHRNKNSKVRNESIFVIIYRDIFDFHINGVHRGGI